MNAQQVADHHSQLCLTVVEDQTAGMQIVVDMLSGERMKSAHDRLTEWRCDAGGRGPSLQLRRCC